MGEIPGQPDVVSVVKNFHAEARVMDPDLLNRVADALGMEIDETEPHTRLLEELAFAQGYGSARGLSVEVTNAMQSALSEHEERLTALGGCV